MSKDRYSDDHEIEVVGDTQTLTVSDHLNVSEDLDVGGDLTVVGGTATATLGVSGNSTLTGTLDVDGTATFDDVIVSGDLTITGDLQRNAATSVRFNLAASAFNPTVNWAVAFTHTHSSDGDFVQIPAGEDLAAAHSLFLPEGSIITDLRVRFEPGAASGFDVSAHIIKRNKISGVKTTVATVTATTGSAGAYNLASEGSIGETVTNSSHTYWVNLSMEAPGAATLDVYEVEVECDVTNYS